MNKDEKVEFYHQICGQSLRLRDTIVRCGSIYFMFESFSYLLDPLNYFYQTYLYPWHFETALISYTYFIK